MRIPETAQNNGPYYEENGAPWQHNGVVMEGAHAAGAGDAPYVHPAHVYSQPQRPPHMPGPGYVVAAGPYYTGYGAAPPMPAPAPAPDDFSDYMWMENEEEFDKQVMQQLEEEALMEQCIEAMLEDERAGERQRLNGHIKANGGPSVSLEEQVSKSTLNPLAAEFVPTRSATSSITASPPHTSTQEKPTAPAPVEVSVNDAVSVSAPAPAIKAEAPAAPASETKQTEETQDTPDPAVAQTETPAEVDGSEPKKTDAKSKSKDSKKDERPKAEAKKAEPKPAKTEAKPKVEAKPKAEAKAAKTEVKPVKTETKPTVVKAELKSVKTEAKPAKSKVEVVKVPSKTAPKKEARSVKSEVRLESREPKLAEAEAAPAPTAAAPVAPATDIIKSQPAAVLEPMTASVAPVPKPINYAAAARANKPKKADK